MKKDKQKVIDEVWTEDRVRSFLELLPPDNCDADFHRLQRAYQSMRVDDFQLFLGMCREAGMNLDATGPTGETLLQEISRHRLSAPFADALRAAGAN